MSIELQSLLQLKDSGLYASLPASRLAALSFRNGFASLCLRDKTDNKILAFEEWACDTPDFPAQISDVRDSLLAAFPWLSDSATQVVLSLDVPKFSMVPSTLFDTAKKDAYLRLQYNMDVSGEWVYTDNLEVLDAVMVYALPLSVENRLKSAFPGAVIKHSKSILLEKLTDIASRRPAPELGFLHVEKDSMDVIIFKSGKLSFFNTFAYKTFDDLAYFTILALNDCDLFPDQFPLQICGSLAGNPELKETLVRFVPGLIALDISQDIRTASTFQKTPLNELFPLIATES